MRLHLLGPLAFLTTVACGASTEPPPIVIVRIDVTPALKELLPGETQQFSAALYGEADVLVSGPEVTWEVDDGTVASVSTGGMVQALKPGEVNLTARSGTASGTATAHVMMVPGHYTLRTANGLPVPAVITESLSCPPGEPNTPISRSITVSPGYISFYHFGNDPLGQPSTFLDRVDWNVYLPNCVDRRSNWGGAFSQHYTVRGNRIIFGAIVGNHSNLLYSSGWGGGAGRLSNDSIFVRWKGQGFPTDSLDFVYVKQ
jgi:hypothetical protein